MGVGDLCWSNVAQLGGPGKSASVMLRLCPAVGYKVMRSMGVKMTRLTNSRGKPCWLVSVWVLSTCAMLRPESGVLILFYKNATWTA